MTAQVVAPSMAPYRSWTPPLLVLTTQKTAEADPEQLQMHKEIAEAHRAGGATAEAMVLQGAGHDLLMTNSTYATRIGALIMGFVRVQEKDSIRHGQGCRSGGRSRFSVITQAPDHRLMDGCVPPASAPPTLRVKSTATRSPW